MSPSSSGLGLGIFDPATGVRLPLGTLKPFPSGKALTFYCKEANIKFAASGKNKKILNCRGNRQEGEWNARIQTKFGN